MTAYRENAYRECACACHRPPAARLNWRWWTYPPLVLFAVSVGLVAELPSLLGSADGRTKTAAIRRNSPAEAVQMEEYIGCTTVLGAHDVVYECVRKWGTQ